MFGWLITGFAAGIAATPHCLGMCGGFPIHIARDGGKGSPAFRQVLFVTGKMFTYVFLGVVSASLGAVLFKNTVLANYAYILRWTAGVLTVVFGLLMIGFKLPSFKLLQSVSDTAFAKSIFGGLFVNPTPVSSVVLGMGVGFLPCPLPMGMLVVAAASHNILQGAALMAGVGLGTAPGLLTWGLFGVGLGRRFARYGMRAVGVVVLAIGLLTIGRVSGIVSSHHPVNHVVPSCCCEESGK